MGRIRSIKPEFPQSESMGRISRDARLCFVEMWTIADDEGRLRGSSRMLASLLFPYDDDAPKLIDTWLSELQAEDCIVRYEVGDAHYIQIVKWLEHQKIDRPSKSKIPQFDLSSRTIASPRESSCEDLRTKDQVSTSSSDKSSEEGAEAPLEKRLYDFGKQFLGKSSGGQITKLRKKYPDPEVLRLLEVAATKSNPAEYVGRIVAGETVVSAEIFAEQQREEYRRMGVDL